MGNSNGTGKLIAALLLGAVAGVSLGILFAPAKGSETRNRLAGGARDLANDLKQKVTDEATILRNKAEALAEAAQEKMNGISNKIMQKVDAMEQHI